MLHVVTYLPHFISTVVMVGIMLILLSPSNGIYGNLAHLLGIQNPVNIMGEASAFQHIYVWSDVWQHAGWDSIIYIAALAAIDPSLYEAATVGRRQQVPAPAVHRPAFPDPHRRDPADHARRQRDESGASKRFT